MASVERLLRLLLRQIDRHPKGALDSVDLADAEPAFVERLLTDRIITEEIPLQDVAPDPASQDELPLPIWRRGERAIAFSIEAGSAPEPVDPRELVQYPIDVLRLCTAIRKDNNLSGSGPEVLSHRTILIGWKSDKLGRRPVVLCRLLRDGNAYETVHMLASRLNTDRLILVSPTERTLGVDLLNSLRARGVQIVPAELALEGSIAQPFALRLEEWGPRASSAPDADVALFIDTGGHRAFLFGHGLELRPREFKVLVELAKAYPGGGYVSRDQLYHVVYPDARDGDPKIYDEQVTDAVSRLRAAFRKAAKTAGRMIGTIIETKTKVGYRLARDLGPVQVR